MLQALCNINMQAVGIRWKWNKKAWMDQMIMKEWLLFFHSHIGNRSVLLIKEIFPAHLAGLELAPSPSNIRICWLPKNSTSHYLPLEQGTIKNFKVHYRPVP